MTPTGDLRLRRRLLPVVLAATFAGCGGNEPSAAENVPARAPSSERKADPDAGNRPDAVERARCPAGVSGCRSATGTILYVERVDPDGDGDAHFVLASTESITAPGISVIDVARELRPDSLPGPGEVISAAGPVFPGSHGQMQIEADVLEVSTR